MMRRVSAFLAAMTMPPVFRSMRLHRAGVKAFSHRGVHLVGVDHQAGPLVQQQQILVLIHDVQAGLEQRQEKIVLPGLVKELVVDV